MFFRSIKNNKGFTLVELMVVVVIIGILVSIVVPIYGNMVETAERNVLQANMRVIRDQIQFLTMEEGFHETNNDGTEKLAQQLEEKLIASIANPINNSANIIRSMDTGSYEQAAILVAFTEDYMEEYYTNGISYSYALEEEGMIIVAICKNGYVFHARYKGEPYAIHFYPPDEFGVNINTASLEELQMITGIGPTLAQRIIDDRPFNSLDDLTGVTGIGPATVENIKSEGIAYVQ